MSVILFIQQKNEQSSVAVSSFTSSSMTVTAGNAIVQDMSGNATGINTLTASDDKVDTFKTAAWKHQTGGTPNDLVTIAWAVNIVGGSTAFKVTPDVSAVVSLCAKEYSGLSATTETSAGAEASSSTISPGAVTAPTPNSLYVAAWTHDGSLSQTFTFNLSGQGWTARSNLTSTTLQPLGSQDIIGTGSKTGSAGVVGGSVLWDACVATFPPAESNVTSPPTITRRVPPQQRMT
jgi:hypothetical protein